MGQVDRHVVGKMRKVLRNHPELSRTAVAVGEALLDLYSIQGLAFPSYERLGKRVRASVRTIGRAIHELQAAGLLRWRRRRRKPNVYAFAFSLVEAAWSRLAGPFNDASYPFAGGALWRRPAVLAVKPPGIEPLPKLSAEALALFSGVRR